jgi:hypothetical protein
LTPTNELRWVERYESVPVYGYGDITERKLVRVLQQKWEVARWPVENGWEWRYEWRDVPVEKE